MSAVSAVSKAWVWDHIPFPPFSDSVAPGHAQPSLDDWLAREAASARAHSAEVPERWMGEAPQPGVEVSQPSNEQVVARATLCPPMAFAHRYDRVPTSYRY